VLTLFLLFLFCLFTLLFSSKSCMVEATQALLWGTLAASLVGALASLATFVYICFSSRPHIEAVAPRLVRDDDVKAKLDASSSSSSCPSFSSLSTPLLVSEPNPANEVIEIPESPPKLSYLQVENTPRAANISFKNLAPPSTSKKRGRGLQRGSDSILDRFTEMQGALLSDAHSFYISDWTNEYPTLALESQAMNPNTNVEILLQRARLIYEASTKTFPYVSGIYIGKTSRIRISERFGLHRKKAIGKPAAVMMFALGNFADRDVPDHFASFAIGGEILSLLYESLLTTAIRLSNLPEFKEDVLAGGGRIGSNEVGLVYMVLVVSNEILL